MQNRKPSQTSDWTVLSLLRWAASYFSEKNVESPRASAEILLAHALDIRRIDLYLQYDRPLLSKELAAFKSLVQRRLRKEPVAYILGEREFWSLAFAVSPDVLIPRPETECLVETAVHILEKSVNRTTFRVADLGTGSGAISIALATQLPRLRLVATDISRRALACAQGNANRHNCLDRIGFVCTDWFSAFQKAPRFTMIVSNPPYIPSDVISTLQAEIREYEPLSALEGGPDGFSAIDRLIRQAPDYLCPGGWLVMEIGHDQHSTVETMAREADAWEDIQFFQDYGGHSRVAVMRKKKAPQPVCPPQEH